MFLNFQVFRKKVTQLDLHLNKLGIHFIKDILTQALGQAVMITIINQKWVRVLRFGQRVIKALLPFKALEEIYKVIKL